MKASRRTQPYRKNTGRHPSLGLAAMLRGRTAYGRNPQDVQRATMKRRRRRV